MEARPHWPGIILGLVTTAVIAWLGWLALQPGLGYGIIFVLLVAVVVALPLLLALIIVTIVLLRRRTAPSRATLAWMWLPTLCALSITPVAAWLKGLSNDAFDRQHPSIHEQHVNLTGQDLWLPSGRLSSSSARQMLAADTTQIIDGVHYPQRGDVPVDDQSPYQGDLLRDDVVAIRRGIGPLEKNGNLFAPRFESTPLLRTGRSVDVAQLRALDPLFRRGYIYHHYPDRVEVSPILDPPGVFDEERLDWTGIPFIHFHAANLGQTHVVRIEVDGQAMRLPYNTIPPASDGCRYAYHSLGLAGIENKGPVTVRWQTIDAPGRWHETTAALPSLPPIHPSQAKQRLASALLYFDTDGTVKAESFMLWDLAGGKLGIQSSGIPAGMAPPPCGDAAGRYNMESVRRL